MTSLTDFTLFSSLSLEIRQLIWYQSLPGPRALLITRYGAQAEIQPEASRPLWKTLFAKFKPQKTTARRPYPKYAIAAASYGGKQPVALSVSHESRAEALRHLTPVLGIYWNLEIDMPYFEQSVSDVYREDAVTLIKEMRLAGELDIFRGIAIDWVLWQKYRLRLARDGVLSGDYHPFTAKKELSNIKSCIFVHPFKLKKKDVVNFDISWSLVPYKIRNQALVVEFEQAKEELKTQHDLDIRYMTINGREKAGFSNVEYARYQSTRDMGRFDWFG